MDIDFSNIEVEDNIPIPRGKTRTQGLANFIKQLKPGQSFFLPFSDRKPTSLVSSCHTAGKNAGVRVKISRCEKNGEKGIRVHRLPEESKSGQKARLK